MSEEKKNTGNAEVCELKDENLEEVNGGATLVGECRKKYGLEEALKVQGSSF